MTIEDDELVRIELGSNLFHNQVIAEACAAEGLRVELIDATHDVNQGIGALASPSYLPTPLRCMLASTRTLTKSSDAWCKKVVSCTRSG